MNRKQTFALGVLMAAGVLSFLSCKRNVFDEEKYIEIVTQQSPVDSIEAGHNFTLAASHQIKVTANVEAGAKWLRILTDNPTTGHAATILGETYCADGETVSLTFSAPVNQTAFYAALVDADEIHYTLRQFSASDSEIDFSEPMVVRGRRTRIPTVQTFSYCYEDQQPEASEYSYNDLVLRMSYQRTGEKELSLTVSLAAVGTTKKLAAAIRLPGIPKTAIDSIATEGERKGRGEDFDRNYDPLGTEYLTQEGLLMRANTSGEAVVRLFEDAHWAIDPSLTVDHGMMTRKRYNVVPTPGDDYELVTPRTIVYHIYFNDASALNSFRLDAIDPFVVYGYNGALWEIHLYPFQGTEVFYEYNLVKSVKLLPWAIMVPKGDFRYPRTGYEIGYYRNGALFGTYMTVGHSFGEWVVDHTASTDWYDYPTLNMAF